MSITLRDVKTSDAAIITKWKTDPYITEMKFEHEHQTNEDEQMHDIQQSIKSFFKEYKIIEHDNKPIGYVRVDWLDTYKYYAWIRFALGEERGHGFSKQAVEQYMKELFSGDCKRIEGEIYEHNVPAQKIVEQLGFTREGIKRKAHFNGKDFVDVYVYGLLKEDLEE